MQYHPLSQNLRIAVSCATTVLPKFPFKPPFQVLEVMTSWPARAKKVELSMRSRMLRHQRVRQDQLRGARAGKQTSPSAPADFHALLLLQEERRE